MTSIDQRVVVMRFDNALFEQKISQTIRSLEELNKRLQLQGAAKGLTDVGAAASRQQGSIKNLESSVQALSDRFKALSVVATTALATVTHQAVSAGGRLAKSLTLDPIMDGFREYETNINSIQTILANTAHAGTTLKDVTAALDELNHYSDQTIYNFSEMAKNIGTFTAAGVNLDTATNAIKGIANLAAVSGSNSQQASAAMYQLSQAISAGRVTLEDWNSVVNAGLGGKVFQDSLMETARVHGVAIDQMVKDEGSFRLTLQKGWLTSEILTETLSKFTGDLTAAQLKTMGYNDQQIKGILKMGKIAVGAATEVKTMTQLIGTLQESASSGWAKTWQIIFGDFNEAKGLFTSVSNVLGGVIESSADSRNKMLSDWKELGGRTVIIKAISNAFQALVAVIKPIRDAFRQIFPATTGKQLYEMSVAIRNFTAGLKIGGQTAENLRRTFAGVFALFDIGFTIIKEVVKTFFSLIGVATQGSGGFLELTGNIGDFLVSVRNAIKQGKGLENIFKAIGTVLAVPIRLIQMLAEVLASLFSGLDGSGVEATLTGVSEKLEPLGILGEVIATVWGKVLTIFGNVAKFFVNLGSVTADFFGDFGTQIAEFVQGLDFGDVLAGINTGLFASLVLMLRNLIGGGGAGGIMEQVTEGIENFTGVLGAMQNTLRAATLLQIAAAIGILAISMNVLSKIDGEDLTKAGIAIGSLFTQLITALLVFEKFSSFSGVAKLPFIAAGMILLGLAINILALAVKQLAKLDWEGLAKGLVGVAGVLGLIVASLKLMPNPAGLISTGIGMIALAAGVKILASAVTDLSGLSWEEIAKGLVGVAGLLGSLALFTKFSQASKGGLIQGAGIILLAAGIKILASAMKDLGGLGWEEIAKGLVSMAGALVLIAAALILIPPSSVLSAAAVLIVAASLGMIGDALKSMGSMEWEQIAKGLISLAGALTIIALAIGLLPPSSLLSAAAVFVVAASLGMISDALKEMGSMGWEEIAKGLVALAGALLIISGAMILMSVALPGAAALVVVAGALTILVPVLQTLGQMSWGEIIKGLVALAGVFAILGIAGLLLAPIIPMILGLGVAVGILGIGMLAAGAGVLAFAAGLTLLAAAGAAGTAAIIGIVSGLIGLIPMVIEQIGKGLVLFAKVIATAGPAITKAIVTVLNSLINAIAKLTPKIVNTLLRLLVMLLNALASYVPKMVDAGLRLITGILNGIAKNIQGVVTAATNVVTNFLKGISNNTPKVIQAGVDMIVKFINSLADAIRNNSARMGEAGANLASAMIEGMVSGLSAGLGRITAKAREIASNALRAAKNALGIKSPSKEFIKVGKSVNEGFYKGLTSGDRDKVVSAFNDLRTLLRDTMRATAEDVEKAEEKLKRLTKARHKDAAAIKKARKELAQARVEHARTTAAYQYMTKSLTDERDKIKKLSTDYTKITEKLKDANQVLKDAIKTRDDYNKSIKDQYSDLPDITGETKLTEYVDVLQKQIDDTKIFSYAIQRLRDLGLNDQLYRELLSKGLSALPFVSQILDGGKASVDQINKLGSQLESVAGKLGTTASRELYQAGVDAAAGLVAGLKKQQNTIAKQIEKIADYMVKAINKKLGIKSPSRIFAEIGEYTGEGLAKGLLDSSSLIKKSANRVGEDAINSLRTSLSGISSLINAEVDMSPTIRPVLDLTGVAQDARHINSMLSSKTISVGATYARAREVSAGALSNQAALAEQTFASQGDNVTFIQNNMSPRALSAAEIYRQTKNQLSVAKGALKT